MGVRESCAFAFVDFSTAQEAANAMTCLKNSHLYGRHLVIEWAKDEDDEGGEEAASHVKSNVVSVRSAGDGLSKLRKRARADEKIVLEHRKRAAIVAGKAGVSEGEDEDGANNWCN